MAAESSEVITCATNAPAHKGQLGQADQPAGETEDQRPLPACRASGGKHDQQQKQNQRAGQQQHAVAEKSQKIPIQHITLR